MKERSLAPIRFFFEGETYNSFCCTGVKDFDEEAHMIFLVINMVSLIRMFQYMSLLALGYKTINEYDVFHFHFIIFPLSVISFKLVLSHVFIYHKSKGILLRIGD